MVYLDQAATSFPKLEEVKQAVMRAFDVAGNANRSSNMDSSRLIFAARRNIAQFFGLSDFHRVILNGGNTESLNTCIKGILKENDHVITTYAEHNSVLRPLYEMEKNGVELSIIRCDEKGMPDISQMEASIKENTKMIICTNGSNLTGNYVDVSVIGKMAHAHGLMFVVDASQTAGVFPINVQEMNIDILCFTGHKGLLGPQGTGGIYVKEGIELRPLKTGGSGIQTYSKEHPVQMPTALEAGTLNGHGIAGLHAALGYLKKEGIDNIRKKEENLMWRFYNGVKDVPGVKIYGDYSQKERCAIVTLNIGDYDSSEVSDELLMEYDISTRSGGHCAPLMHEALGTVEQGAVRFSFSHYNTEEEVDTAIRAIRELAEEP